MNRCGEQGFANLVTRELLLLEKDDIDGPASRRMSPSELPAGPPPTTTSRSPSTNPPLLFTRLIFPHTLLVPREIDPIGALGSGMYQYERRVRELQVMRRVCAFAA